MAKTADVIINFKGTDPVASTGRYDKIPEGTYHVKVKKAELTQTQTDKPAISLNLVVTKGPLTGKTVRDMFVLPRKGEKDAKFGQQRLLGTAIACGIKRIAGKVKAKTVAKTLEGRECICEIADSTIPARENYAERVTSAPQAYYATKSKDGKAALKAFEARSSDDDEEEEDEDEEEEDDSDDTDEEEDDDGDEEDDEDEDDDDEEEEEEEEEKPKKKRSKKAKKAKKSSKKSKKDEDDDDDLYDDDDDDEDEDEDED